MITKEIALAATYRQEFTHKTLKDSRKNPLRARVNGKCVVWKGLTPAHSASDFKLPMKYGLKECFYITPENAGDWQA